MRARPARDGDGCGWPHQRRCGLRGGGRGAGRRRADRAGARAAGGAGGGARPRAGRAGGCGGAAGPGAGRGVPGRALAPLRRAGLRRLDDCRRDSGLPLRGGDGGRAAEREGGGRGLGRRAEEGDARGDGALPGADVRGDRGADRGRRGGGGMGGAARAGEAGAGGGAGDGEAGMGGGGEFRDGGRHRALPPPRPSPASGGGRQSPPPLAGEGWVGEPPASTDILVIGGGIIGLCIALAAARDGRQVTVLDRGEPGQAASTANAGSLHVQLHAYDSAGATEGPGSAAAQILSLGPASVALWRGDRTGGGGGPRDPHRGRAHAGGDAGTPRAARGQGRDGARLRRGERDARRQ
jgi:hypothetical protein